jgi:hypothetical protein
MHISVLVFLVHAKNMMSVMTVAAVRGKIVTTTSVKPCFNPVQHNMAQGWAGKAAIGWHELIAEQYERTVSNTIKINCAVLFSMDINI